MNFWINLPEHVASMLAKRAAECGKDIETFAAEVLCDELEPPVTSNSTLESDFDLWISEARRLVPRTDGSVDDSRDSIY